MLRTNMKNKLRYGIFILAYNVASTLIAAYERIPVKIKRGASTIYCLDDHSGDNTYFAAMGYKLLRRIEKFRVFRNPRNLGYGGNQKRGYRYAITQKLDVVVMLHGDVQYSPEKMPLLLKPFEEQDWRQIGVVMGSRMLGRPLEGGMPYYKFIGNKILTHLENIILGTNFSEFHSGYRAYNTNVFKAIPLSKLSNSYHFDTEMIIFLNHLGYRIIEVPIPTYYGPGSKSGVKVFSYGLSCLNAVLKYQLSQLGLIKDSIYSVSPYSFKHHSNSSHMLIASLIKKCNFRTVLDLGCAGGFLASALGPTWQGDLIGIEKSHSWKRFAAINRYSTVYWRSLNKPLPKTSSEVTVAADVLEHLNKPETVINQINSKYLIVSLPNSNYLPARILRFLFPRHKFTRGPFDSTHLHFFTDKSSQELINRSKYSIISKQVTPAPFFTSIGIVLARLLTQHFAYQYVYLAINKKYQSN
ncbi:MAG: Glycosyl transferase, family 2 [Candidatus Amesbacteria bacterium GW2011_GWB1_47_26]|nr:MAG: Glycosyl transferase, family 2 [Candidatus Amesbacteria bacterium GW2011_GWB1_47_26]